MNRIEKRNLFVRTWEESSSGQEVADKLKITKLSATARASSYRRPVIKDGVVVRRAIPLKKMGHGFGGSHTMTDDGIADLLADIRGVDAATIEVEMAQATKDSIEKKAAKVAVQVATTD